MGVDLCSESDIGDMDAARFSGRAECAAHIFYVVPTNFGGEISISFSGEGSSGKESALFFSGNESSLNQAGGEFRGARSTKVTAPARCEIPSMYLLRNVRRCFPRFLLPFALLPLYDLPGGEARRKIPAFAS